MAAAAAATATDAATVRQAARIRLRDSLSNFSHVVSTVVQQVINAFLDLVVLVLGSRADQRDVLYLASELSERLALQQQQQRDTSG